MKLEIYINDKLWKSVTIDGDSYQPNEYWAQINLEKSQGMLSSFNIDEVMKIEFRKV
jgi:hypothetical protein